MENAENAIFRIACPQCGVSYRVPADKRGVRFRCKKCQNAVIDTRGITAANEIRDDHTPTISIDAQRADSERAKGAMANGDTQWRRPVERISHDTCLPNTILMGGKQETPTSREIAAERKAKTEIETPPVSKRANLPVVSDKSDNLEYYTGKPLANKIIGSDTTFLPSVEMEQLRKEQKHDGLVEW